MGIIGFQLVITLVMMSFMQKMKRYSFARWLLCSRGLHQYLSPNNKELRALAGVPKDRPKNKKGNRTEFNEQIETFHVPRNLDIQLNTSLLTPIDVIYLRFYAEYHWLVDFSLYSFLVYIFSEMYVSYFPDKEELNLSLVWCCLCVIFAFKLLLSLTKMYFVGDQSIGERSTCIVSFCVFLLIAMIVLIVDEDNLELGLDSAYENFHENASRFIKTSRLPSAGPASKLFLKFTLAVWAALIGSIFTFPGIRVAMMHCDSLRYYSHDTLKLMLMNVNFALPFIVACLWVRPISRHYLTVRIFTGMEQPIMSSAMFNSFRVSLLLFMVVMRVVLMDRQMQAYLDLAQKRVDTQKQEAGRITNVEIRRKVATVYFYLGVVCLQYLCPIIMCGFLGMMYKTLGNYSWFSMIFEPPSQIAIETPIVNKVIEVLEDTDQEDTANQFLLAWEHLKMVFSPVVFRGVLGFSTWWCVFAWFLTTSFGLAYHKYFSTT